MRVYNRDLCGFVTIPTTVTKSIANQSVNQSIISTLPATAVALFQDHNHKKTNTFSTDQHVDSQHKVQIRCIQVNKHSVSITIVPLYFYYN